MIAATILALFSFLAGLAVAHAYREDVGLWGFQEALLTVCRAPLQLAQAGIRAARSASEKAESKALVNNRVASK